MAVMITVVITRISTVGRTLTQKPNTSQHGHRPTFFGRLLFRVSGFGVSEAIILHTLQGVQVVKLDPVTV